MDRVLLFFFTSLILISIYRIVLSARLLSRKSDLLDEKFYVLFFYISIVDVLVIIFRNVVLGFILVGVTPIIMTLYVAFAPSRIYWIKNGYELTDATFNNELMVSLPQYKEFIDLYRDVVFSHKKSEKKTKVIIKVKEYELKEKILSIIKQVCKQKSQKVNKSEIVYLLVYSLIILLAILGLLILLFT